MQTLSRTAADARALDGADRVHRVLAVLVPGSSPVDVVRRAADLVEPEGVVIVTGLRASRHLLTPMGFITEVGVTLWCHPDDEPQVMMSRAAAELAGLGISCRFEHVEPRDSAFASRRRRFAAEALARTVERLGADVVVVGSGDVGMDVAAPLRSLTETPIVAVPARMGERPPPV